MRTKTPALARKLLDWYDRSARDLPWRVSPKARAQGVLPDPYTVWLSEIMLQQTTVAAVAPYFEAFLRRWPQVESLAAASQDEVLSAWAGLGYYARARNLHRCAQVLAARGGFPDQAEELAALPGIGPYTAAAIAAIAFDRPRAAVDGNVERVVARLHDIATPLPGAKAELRRLAQELVPGERPGDFAQAIMDLGATLCRKRAPLCVLCPWRGACLAQARGTQDKRPLRAEKPRRPLRRGVAFWLVRADGAILLRRRPEDGLLGGMLEVPSTPWAAEAPETPLDFAPLPAQWRRLPGVVRHVFTHFALELEVRSAKASSGAPVEGRWERPERFDQLALPSLMRKLARHAQAQLARAAPAGRGLKTRAIEPPSGNRQADHLE